MAGKFYDAMFSSNRVKDGESLDYVHVFRTNKRAQFDFLLWGALQNGAWGVQSQHARALFGEIGWQTVVHVLNPWLSAGYSYILRARMGPRA